MALETLWPWLISGGLGVAAGGSAFVMARKKIQAAQQTALDAETRAQKLQKALTEAESTHSSLEEHSERAHEALEVRTQFLANISHEIRTPLNGVLGMTSVLLETDLSREQRDIAMTISKSGETLMAILNEILDFSKLEANAIHIESFPFDVRESVEDVLDLFAGLAYDKRLDIASRFAPGLPPQVVGDVIRVRQVLSNLVSNAVKFTDRGEVVIDVELEDDTLVFTVSDSGIGMDENALGKLFVPFTQFNRYNNQPGTGLGLVICRRLTELMNGTVSVTSSPGLGTEFVVQIPVGTTTMRPSDSLWDAPGTRVCIVGPELTSRDVLGDYLREWGFTVIVCENAAKAPQETDLLVLFAESVDASAAALPPNIPRIFVSWLADVSSHEKADALGRVIVLDRPVRQRSLRHALQQALYGETTSSRRSLSRFGELASRLPRRILVAEDNPTNRRVATVMLKQLGYEPVVVENGAQALEATRHQRFDVIFMDIHMPVMDGIEATQRIRDLLPRDSQPWIVALTAGVNSEVRTRAHDAGINEFVTKPFMVESLRATIEHSQAGGPTRVVDHTSSKHFDQLKALYSSTPDEFRDLIDGHLRSVELLLADMDRAVDAHDAQTLALAAHSLKASSRMFGHAQMGEVAESVETLAGDLDLDTARRHVLLLHAHWDDARTSLEQERDTFQGS